jgi:hypothetical protein
MCLVRPIRLLHPADMSLLARLLLSWTAVSVVVSPLVGGLLHRQQLDLPLATEPVR